MGWLKKSLIYFLAVYISLMVYDFIVHDKLEWAENIIMPLMFAAVVSFLEWGKPKNKDNKNSIT
ncbi:hypothetical protein P4V41_20500 [Fictibacillus nanhaiensis]|uniref:hypothetical protein n=1 Tax=Fictibacillus nanhaiensis TaxID=742169 RepID=UPI002E1F6E62|nr:hypothetical protein [Fictibacillus nanhaiensis]